MPTAEHEFLRLLFHTAVNAAAPRTCLAPHLPPPPKGRTIVVGAGKAAAAMASVVEAHWPADLPLHGLVVTRYHHGEANLRRIEVVEAGHPVPDDAGRDAALRMLALVRGLTEDDLVLCLMSGGASALLGLPAPGISLADKQEINRALLRSGAAIGEMNTLRKHLSAIKGGRLGQAAAPARVVTLLISDVPGDDPAVIGSGPTVPDASTLADARAVLARYNITPSPAVEAHLRDPASETPKPGSVVFARNTVTIIATAQDALDAAAAAARNAGITPLILGNAIEGESREVARVMAAIALQAASFSQPAAPPCVLLSGGETTVTLRGHGRGGRNAEFLLSLAVALDEHRHIHAIACDTDGIDGTENNAGAILSPDSLARARARGADARARLADNDGYGFFEAIGDLVITGPTRTNVNDFRAILISARQDAQC
jgi:glycerate 2-kinase